MVIDRHLEEGAPFARSTEFVTRKVASQKYRQPWIIPERFGRLYQPGSTADSVSWQPLK